MSKKSSLFVFSQLEGHLCKLCLLGKVSDITPVQSLDYFTLLYSDYYKFNTP